MMKKVLFIALMAFSLFANEQSGVYAPSSECKTCHSSIYNEFTASQHQNATIFKDPIHAAVWKKHPKNHKKQQYGCAKCHTPAADNLDAMITKGQKGLPDANNATQNEAISCAYCHRITGIKKGQKRNSNIIDPKEKRYHGTLKNAIDSPYHEIATTGNEPMANGNVCVGCHSHKKNKANLNVCSTNINNELDGANCVSCHMPQVKGSASDMVDTKKHAFHGFPGSHSNQEMLAKYINISMVRSINNFVINVDNQSSHALLLHPLRLAVLNVSVERDGKKIKLKKEVFVRVIGKDGKPAMPWVADKVIKNSMIQHNEKRVITYDFKLQKGDKVTADLGYFLVNPKVVKKLGLQDNKVATKRHTLKVEKFTIN